MQKVQIILILFSFLFLTFSNLFSQQWDVNYEEDKVGHYSLPQVLKSQSGIVINNPNDWETFRKPEIITSLTYHIYGKIPGKLDTMRISTREIDSMALNGIAKRKQITLTFVKGNKEINTDLLIYLPKSVKKAPVFLGYNFWGNHTISDEENIYISDSWVQINEQLNIITNHADEKSRGTMKRRWPIEKIIAAGYGIVTLYRGDIDPDKDDFNDGVHPLFYERGQEKPKDDEWGTIAAWSWGLSRVMDYLEKDHDIDSKKVIVFGHSRLGKVSMWAAASDNRFAACITNNSGAMGAALSRRNYGETIEVINTAFPHWFCSNFKKYSKKEYILPIDQHMVFSLIAPRPVYAASASEDRWADPKGEFLSLKEASVVYNLYGIHGLSSSSMPEPDNPIIGNMGYHIRTGGHDIIEYDWEQYLKFAKYNDF